MKKTDSTPLRDKVAYLGVFLALALICSYVESLIPFYFGIPGVKLGLTNIVVVLMLYCVGTKEAFAREKRSRVLALGVVQLVDRGLELWVLLDVLLEYILIVRSVGNREISCLGCPVCLGLCRHQIFHELPGRLCLYVILVLDCPEGCSADGHTALICILDAREICGSHLKGAVDVV